MPETMEDLSEHVIAGGAVSGPSPAAEAFDPPPGDTEFDLMQGDVDFDTLDLETLAEIFENAPAPTAPSASVAMLVGLPDEENETVVEPPVPKRARAAPASWPPTVVPALTPATLVEVSSPRATVTDPQREAKRERRRLAIERWKLKRKKRVWRKGPTHKTRTEAAGARERIKGRFAPSTRGFFSVTELA